VQASAVEELPSLTLWLNEDPEPEVGEFKRALAPNLKGPLFSGKCVTRARQEPSTWQVSGKCVARALGVASLRDECFASDVDARWAKTAPMLFGEE